MCPTFFAYSYTVYGAICYLYIWPQWVNTLRPRQNGRRFANDTFKPIFLNENVQISIKISLKFVPKVPIDNIPALVQMRAWRRLGDKPLSEPMMVCLLTHIYVTRPQWVNQLAHGRCGCNFEWVIVKQDLWLVNIGSGLQVMAWCHQATSLYPSKY